MSKHTNADRALLITLAAFLLVGGISAALFPAPRRSEQENRMLAAFPEASANALASGEYTAAIDTYLAERFPARSLLRNLHAVTKLGIGNRSVGGVMLCQGNTLLATPLPNTTVLRKNLYACTQVLATAQELSLPTTTVIIPHRTEALLSLAPCTYRQASVDLSAREALPHAVFLDCLQEKKDWYRTDHHLTTEGAYRAYTALAAVLGFTAYPREGFQITTATEDFLGTLDAKAGIPFLHPDSISLWRFAGDVEYVVLRDESAADLDAFYDVEQLQHRDKYAVFFGGNCGTLEIKQGENDTRPTLLVVKDSYANAILPFLARHYQIIALDPRHAGRETMAAYMEKADACLLLCGVQTLTETPFLS